MRVDADDLADYMGPAPIDIGSDVKIRFYHFRDGRRGGLFQVHKTEFGENCVGAVPFVVPGVSERDGSTPMWDVVQEEPLTLSPSISCTSCSRHGFIREGRWGKV